LKVATCVCEVRGEAKVLLAGSPPPLMSFNVSVSLSQDVHNLALWPASALLQVDGPCSACERHVCVSWRKRPQRKRLRRLHGSLVHPTSCHTCFVHVLHLPIAPCTCSGDVHRVVVSSASQRAVVGPSTTDTHPTCLLRNLTHCTHICHCRWAHAKMHPSSFGCCAQGGGARHG
jgi:hypothetical protein